MVWAKYSLLDTLDPLGTGIFKRPFLGSMCFGVAGKLDHNTLSGFLCVPGAPNWPK